jgi:hypothetical protein
VSLVEEACLLAAMFQERALVFGRSSKTNKSTGKNSESSSSRSSTDVRPMLNALRSALLKKKTVRRRQRSAVETETAKIYSFGDEGETEEEGVPSISGRALLAVEQTRNSLLKEARRQMANAAKAAAAAEVVVAKEGVLTNLSQASPGGPCVGRSAQLLSICAKEDNPKTAGVADVTGALLALAYPDRVAKVQ